MFHLGCPVSVQVRTIVAWYVHIVKHIVVPWCMKHIVASDERGLLINTETLCDSANLSRHRVPLSVLLRPPLRVGLCDLTVYRYNNPLPMSRFERAIELTAGKSTRVFTSKHLLYA